MSDDLSTEDILKLIQQQGNKNINQSPDTSVENILMSLIMNPNNKSTTRTQLMDKPSNGTIFETVEGTTLNADGFIEDIKQENISVLDDGTSMKGVTRCQTCGGIIKEESLKRCPCGKTCCVIQGCGKYSKSKDQWYCCSFHLFLGYFGISLR